MLHLPKLVHVAVICLMAHGFVSNRVGADDLSSDQERIELQIEKLVQSDDPADFPRALNAVQRLIAKGQMSEVFEYGVLIAKLRDAADRRLIRAGYSKGESNPESNSDLLSSKFLLGGSPDSTDDANPKISFSNRNKESGESAEQKKFNRRIAEFSASLKRQFFIFYRKYFSGQEDLRRMVDRVTKDEDRRKLLLTRWTSEFEALDKKYDVLSGKLAPEK